MDLRKFKEEFRGRATDFAVSGHLIHNFSSKTATAKAREAEELYIKLETWVLEQFKPTIEHPIMQIDEKNPQDTTLDLGF